MKVIDLLNKIANGEAPSKIRYKDTIYDYKDTGQEIGYVNEYGFEKNWFTNCLDIDDKFALNDEVDIIQDNKIELDLYTNARCGKQMTTEEQDYNWELISKNFEIINKKLNEVLNEKDR